MNLHLTAHHLEITPAIRDYSTEKFDKIKRHFENVVIDVNVIFSVEKLKQKAEATMHLSGKNLFVECEDENLYAAIDMLVDKLERQVRRHKEKLSDRRHDDSGKLATNE
ncbi:MAG: ribosome-associated translation inhibitor RaiA [Gallionella sp.]|nr:ribosome-associated translation inhibitor RaiA [Gallionella sp.]